MQYAYRSQKKLALVQGSPSYEALGSFTAPDASVKQYAYSSDGSLFATVSNASVQIYETQSGQCKQTVDLTSAVEVAFSPKNTFLCTWARPVKLEGDVQHKNFQLWNTSTGEQVTAFSQKSQDGWNLQFTEDETYALRMVSSEIHIFRTAAFDAGIASKFKLEGATSFSLSPGRNPSLAIFIAEKKGQPASIKIFSLSSIVGSASPAPSCSKTFFKADKVVIKWNAIGTSLLAVTSTDVDKTNKSYYGETNMYLMGTSNGFDCRVTLEKEGPVHDFAWSPNGKEFGVVYGFMPARATIFDHRVNVIHDFGAQPRNYISFNPQARLVLLAGFGNLNGSVDVWDRKTLTKVASFNASNTSHCEWSPDGRFIMCATLSPRLRVDNGIKIFHLTGAMMHIDSVDELYQASWRPASPEAFPFRSSLSPAPTPSVSVPQTPVKTDTPKATGAYRPPHARGTATPDIFKREDEGGKPYVRTNGTSEQSVSSLAALASKPKQRVIPGAAPRTNGHVAKEAPPRRKKKAAGDSTPPVENVVQSVQAPAEEAPLSPEDKKKRALLKKLGAIEQLKDKRDRGEKLEKTQEKKIEGEGEVRRDLLALGWDGKQ